MREYIARLIKSGMDRDVAVCVCSTYAKRKDFDGLKEYVEAVEEENYYNTEEDA